MKIAVHPARSQSRYVVGLDLGQKRDHTAIAVIELRRELLPERDPVTWSFLHEESMRMVHLERVPLGTTYTDVVARVGAMFGDTRLHGATLVADGTGVGAPVVDLLRKAGLPCRIVAVTITSGHHAHATAGGYSVPKLDLISGMQVVVERGTLQIAKQLPMAEELVKELTGMRKGSRDDLVLATSLACWWVKKTEASAKPQGRLV